MRIALLTDGLWPDVIGGMQKHSYYMAKYLSLNNIKVDLYYCAKDIRLIKDLFTFDELLNIRLFKVDFPVFKFNFPGHYVLSSWLYSKNLYKAYKLQKSYDFIYAQGFTGWYFIKNGVRIGSNLHGLEMFQQVFGFKSELVKLMLSIPARTIIRKSAVSFSLGGKLTGILSRQKARIIKETPIGIGEEWLRMNTAHNLKPSFVFVGRNEKRKGLDILFDALQKMDKQNFHFHFIGIRRPYGIEDSSSFFFHGEIREVGRIQEILSKCDILVCPSIAEGMPTVILEAMAMGLAVIGTDTGATALLVDHRNGMLIQPGNTLELLNALEHFISVDAEELKQIKNYSFKKVSEKYIWPVSIKATIQALQD